MCVLDVEQITTVNLDRDTVMRTAGDIMHNDGLLIRMLILNKVNTIFLVNTSPESVIMFCNANDHDHTLH